MGSPKIWLQYGWTETEPGSTADPWFFNQDGVHIKITWRLTTMTTPVYENGDYHLIAEKAYRITDDQFPPGAAEEPTTRDKFETWLNDNETQTMIRYFIAQEDLGGGASAVPQGFEAGVFPTVLTVMGDVTSHPLLDDIPDDYYGA